MARLTVPAGIHRLSHAGHEFEVEDGVIDTGEDAPPHVIRSFIDLLGCAPAAPAQEKAADDKAARVADLKAKLEAAGVKYDKRAGVSMLESAWFTFERDQAAKAAKPAEPAASPDA